MSKQSSLSEIVVVDARTLQDPAYSQRGIGRYASDMITAARQLPASLFLLVDKTMPITGLPVADGYMQASEILRMADRVSLFLEPSPMTHDMGVVSAILRKSRRSIAVVLDFIPALEPNRYLGGLHAEASYRARLALLDQYSEWFCISHETLAQSRALISGSKPSQIVWPDQICEAIDASPVSNFTEGNHLLISAGMDPRKNWIEAVRVAADLSGDWPKQVAVLGVPQAEIDWLLSQEFPNLTGRAFEGYFNVSDVEVKSLFSSARVCIVPSFREGLSLPVIEAICSGSAVVCSDIDVHRELIGYGAYCFDPARPSQMLLALQEVVGNPVAIFEKQLTALRSHTHVSLSTAVRSSFNVVSNQQPVPPKQGSSLKGNAKHKGKPERARIAVISPFPPCQSGVADLSFRMLEAMANFADVTAFGEGSGNGRDSVEPLETLLRQSDQFDKLLVVLGNSHFHLDAILALEALGAISLCHDVRMTEVNAALYGLVGAAEIASLDARANRYTPDDLHTWLAIPERTENVGFGRIAISSEQMLFHSKSAAARVRSETGHSQVHNLPFPAYRFPAQGEQMVEIGRKFRRERGISATTKVVVVPGAVDIRTKAADTCLEAVAYLQMWKHDVVLAFVGEVPKDVRIELEHLASQINVMGTVFTGAVDEDDYRAWLCAADCGMVLRNGGMLSLSGAALDLQAYGIPTVMPETMALDCGSPDLAFPLPLWFTGLQVAEMLERALAGRMSKKDREAASGEFLRDRSIANHAKILTSFLLGTV